MFTINTTVGDTNDDYLYSLAKCLGALPVAFHSIAGEVEREEAKGSVGAG